MRRLLPFGRRSVTTGRVGRSPRATEVTEKIGFPDSVCSACSVVDFKRTLQPATHVFAVLAVAVGVLTAVAAFSARPVLAADDKPHTTWTQYLGGPDSTQYSALKQINKNNVKQLEVAWTHPTGEGTVRFNPLVVDNLMYVLGANRSIVALPRRRRAKRRSSVSTAGSG